MRPADMPPALAEKIVNPLVKEGFIFAASVLMRQMLASYGAAALADWQWFADSWRDLETDSYMADKGRYRKRRYGVYRAAGGAITREPHQAHFQTLDYNPLNGGVERWFEPIHASIGDSASMRTLLAFCCDIFGRLSPATENWHIEAHQFRIEAHADGKGQPTPEGIHRDGRDYVLMLMIRRENIQSGVTTIHDLKRTEIGQFTLTEPFDAALVDDRRVYHGVTAVTPVEPGRPSYRDVLVLTFQAMPS